MPKNSKISIFYIFWMRLKSSAAQIKNQNNQSAEEILKTDVMKKPTDKIHNLNINKYKIKLICFRNSRF